MEKPRKELRVAVAQLVSHATQHAPALAHAAITRRPPFSLRKLLKNLFQLK